MSKVISFSISDRYLDKLRSLYPALTDNLAAKQFLTDGLDSNLGNSLDGSLNDGLDDKVKTLIESWVDGLLDERLDATVGKLLTSLSERMARLEARLDDSLDGRLDDMERLLKLQQSASIASPLPTGEPSPLPPDKLGKGGNGDIFPDSPPSPPDAIEDPEKKIVDFPDTLIASPIENVESVESISSINEPDTDAIESLTSESDSSIEGEDAIETVTPEVSPSPPSPPDAIASIDGTVESVEPNSSIETVASAIESVTDSKPWYTIDELLDCHYPGWPETKEGLRKKALTEGWPRRTRRGSKGNPYEYQAVLPE